MQIIGFKINHKDDDATIRIDTIVDTTKLLIGTCKLHAFSVTKQFYHGDGLLMDHFILNIKKKKKRE